MSRLTIFCWLFAVAPALLSAADAGSPLERGIERFEAGDLDGARRYFEAARADEASLSLTYNLAVVNYRLGDYEAAESGFRKLLLTDHRLLASYNLGLVALARSERAGARAWFLNVSESNAPDQLRALAEAQLQKLQEPERGAPYWTSGYLGLAAGYDSNIAGLPETSASRQGGGFAEGIVAGSLLLDARNAGRLTLQGTAYARQYPTDGEYDTSLLQAKVLWSRELAYGEGGIGVTLSQSWFDAEPLARRYGAEGFQRWHRCAGPVQLTDCSLSVAAAQVAGGSSFEAYDGQWYQLRLSGERRIRRWRLTARYRWEINDRRDLRFSDQFVSVSPASHEVELTAGYPLRPNLQLGWLAALRYSRYTREHVLFDGSELETERRTDLRAETGLFTEYGFDSRWQVRGEWRFRDNDSAISRYDYDRHTVMVTLEAGF